MGKGIQGPEKCMVCTLVKILIIVNDPKAHCHCVFLNSGVLEGINI